MEKVIGSNEKSFTRLLKSLEGHVEKSRNSALDIILKQPKKPRLVVDIGAGHGGMAINYALWGSKVIAIEPEDLQRRIIGFFLKEYPEAKKYLKIVNGAAEKIPLRNNTADLCTLSQVLEHVNNCDKTMSEVARILKPGGYLYLSCPNYLYPFEQHLNIPYFPLMNKSLLLKLATFLLRPKTSWISSFIENINYTTDPMILGLCKKFKLRKIWSATDDTRNLLFQIKEHWNQNPSFLQIFLLAISLPKKLLRSFLANLGVLPMKLEYLFQKKD